VSCSLHASGARRAKAAARSSRFAGPPGGDAQGGQRNRHRLVPASSGAKAPLACEDRRLDGCARASIRLQKSANVAQVQRSVLPVGNGTRGRGPSSGNSARDPPGCKGVGRQPRGGQAAELEEAGAGRSRGRCGAKVVARWKAPRVVSRSASFTRAGTERPRRPTRGFVNARASRARGGGDRGVRGSVRTHRAGKRTPSAVSQKRGSCDPPKRVVLPCSRRSPRQRRRASAGRLRESTRRGC